MSEKQDPEGTTVTDNRDRDTEAMAREIQLLRSQVMRVNDALNMSLAILSGLYLQPFATKRYLPNVEIDHVNFLLANLCKPVAQTLAQGKTDDQAFRDQLTRISVMCLNYFVNRLGIATQGSQIEMGGARYSIREENGIPYSVQEEPDLPKTEWHDQPLYLLLDEVHRRGNYEEREYTETIGPEQEANESTPPDSASKDS